MTHDQQGESVAHDPPIGANLHPAPQASKRRSLSFLAGGGEMGSRMRAFDWAGGSLGPPEAWPQSLKTAIRIMLTSRQPIWIGWGRDLVYFYNDAYQSIIGGKHPWALGLPASVVWREIWDDIEPMLSQAMTGEEGTYVEGQLLIMERYGYPEETYYTFSYSPIPDDDGASGGIICANTDDTQRVIGERQLSLLRDLAASTADARTGAEVCERAARALGADPRDLPFAMIYLSAPEEDRAELAAACGIEPGHPAAPEVLTSDRPVWVFDGAPGDCRLVSDLEARFGARLPSGSWQAPPKQAAVLSLASVGDHRQEGALVVGLNPFRLFDQSYRRFLALVAGQIAGAMANANAYAAERSRAEALAELDKTKTQFFSNVSHEFRTPLTLLLGPLEELLSRSSLADRDREELTLVRRNALRLLKLVNTMLEFSRVEAGRVQASFQATDLAALTADLASNFRAACERAGLRLSIDCPELPEPVFVDREMWEKIVLNLLSNAFKFTFKGAISVALRRIDGLAELSVRDTGAGIAANELPRIFERFHRIENVRGRSHEGTGIGLALVQELVKLHGGEVEASSALGQGATFTVRIPLGASHLPSRQIAMSEVQRETGATRAQAFVEQALRWLPAVSETARFGVDQGAAPHASAGGRPRILLADDNADMRDYVGRLLGEACEVELVGDGVTAMEAIRRRRPDLVLSDVMMPRLDGFGLLREIRSDPDLRDLPVILLSARAGDEARIEGLDAGADDYLTKPFASRELVARVDSNLALARLRRGATQALRQSEERLRLGMQVAGFGILEWMAAEDRSTWSRELCVLLGVASEESSFRKFLELCHPDDRDRVKDTVGSLLQGPGSGASIDEFRVTRPDGALRWFQARWRAFFDEGPERGANRIVGAIQDITAHRAATEGLAAIRADLERQVQERTSQLVQAQKMEVIGQLTGGVAHDFNNLLQAIAGCLFVLGRHVPPGQPRNLFEAAQQSIERGARLTQSLLAFARRQTLAPQATDLRSLLDSMRPLLERTLGGLVAVEIHASPSTPPALVDGSQLESAILNLAVNARDAMPSGGRLTLRVATATVERPGGPDRPADLAPGDYVTVTVEDTGVGMDETTLARVFEPFFTTKEFGKGSGLGLSMVHGMAAQSGGGVRISSIVGGGSKVTLYLPRASAAIAQAASEAEVAPRGDGEVILLVDDDAMVRAGLRIFAEDLGYRVIEAHSGQAATDALRQGDHVDAVVTDFAMPGMNGADLVREARRFAPGIPAMVITGYADTPEAFQNVVLLRKPFLPEQFASCLANILRKTR